MNFKKLFDCKFDIVVLTGIILVFGYFVIFCPAQEYGDSFQYIHQYPMREPVYSLFLQAMIVLLGDNFRVGVSFAQNMLAVVCLFWTYKRISKMYSFGLLFRLGTVAVLLAPHLVTPMASVTHLVLTCSVITEGITLSMYYVFLTILLGMVNGFYEGKSYTIAIVANVILAFVLALTRGQMAVCFVLWLLVVSFRDLCNKKWKSIFIYVVIVICMFPIKSQLTKWYNLAETGYYTDTVSSKPMLLANIVYVCDITDSEYIEDETLQNAFKEMAQKALADGLNVENANGGIIGKALYHEACHDSLNFEYIDPAVRNVIYERFNIDESTFLELMISEDALCKEMSLDLLPHIAGKFLHNYFYVISLGFIRSIAVEKSVIPYLAVALYILAVSLVAFLLTRWKKTGEKSPAALSMIVVLLAICGTVCGTSLMIQCITRYMVYNLPFFYIAGMAMLKELRKS